MILHGYVPPIMSIIWLMRATGNDINDLKKSKLISISMESFCDRIPDGQMFCALSHESQVIDNNTGNREKTEGILERNLQFQEQNQARRLGSVLTKGGRLYLNVFIADLIQTGEGGGGRSPTQYKVCTSHLMGLYLRLSTFCQCQRLAIETSWCLTLECILALQNVFWLSLLFSLTFGFW